MHRQKGEKILMYDRENDNRNNEGRQVQQELEDQLRAFGDTMTDAFAHGFEGRGMDIGDRAWDVGKAAVHAANYGIGEAAKAFRQGRRGYPYGDAKQPSDEGAADADPAGMPGWFRQIFAKPEPTPVESIRISAKKRHSAGCTLLAVGITFAVIFGLGTLGCLIGLGTISPAALGDVVVSATEGGGILMTGTDYVMNTAYNVLGIVSSVLGLATAGFGWMTACGAARMKAGRQMGQFADYADSVDYHKGLPVSMLADQTHQTKKKALKKLRSALKEHAGALEEALRTDLNKQPMESAMCETGVVSAELRYAMRHLKSWMREKRTAAPLYDFPAHGLISPEPLGQVLIISPWNYPVQLCLVPLIGAIAAGNCAVIKPSVKAPETARALKAMLESIYPEEFVCVVEGSHEETAGLLELKWDHIFFTGSQAGGRQIMAAAARHLTPVTLELGGKSPVIVDSTANIKRAARRIASCSSSPGVKYGV